VRTDARFAAWGMTIAVNTARRQFRCRRVRELTARVNCPRCPTTVPIRRMVSTAPGGEIASLR
jgi:hypothetical protein